jgi:hypothetical protein
MAPQILEGTWEEIELQAERLRGKRVRVTVVDDAASFVPNAPFYETASPAEWSRALREWAASHPRTDAVLSEDAISRESIYGERLDALSR